MDNETNKILSEQDMLRELVGHQGWVVARKILLDKILELQDAFQIEDKTATAMLNDLRARKKASRIIYDWLKEIEGTAQQSQDNINLESNRKHIVKEE